MYSLVDGIVLKQNNCVTACIGILLGVSRCNKNQPNSYMRIILAEYLYCTLIKVILLLNRRSKVDASVIWISAAVCVKVSMEMMASLFPSMYKFHFRLS